MLSCPSSLALKHGALDLCPGLPPRSFGVSATPCYAPSASPGPDPRTTTGTSGPGEPRAGEKLPFFPPPLLLLIFCLPPWPELVAIEMSCSGSRPSQPPCLRSRMPLGTAVTLVRHVLPADTQGCAQGGPLHPQACPPPSAGNTVAFPAAGWDPGRTAAPQAKALPSQRQAARAPAPGSVS